MVHRRRAERDERDRGARGEGDGHGGRPHDRAAAPPSARRATALRPAPRPRGRARGEERRRESGRREPEPAVHCPASSATPGTATARVTSQPPPVRTPSATAARQAARPPPSPAAASDDATRRDAAIAAAQTAAIGAPCTTAYGSATRWTTARPLRAAIATVRSAASRRVMGSRIRPLRSGDDLERAHHRVVLVLEDVAVEDVPLRRGDAGRQRPPRADPRDLAGVRAHGVLPAALVRVRAAPAGPVKYGRGSGFAAFGSVARACSSAALYASASNGVRSMIWNCTRCRWIGCVSSVRFTSRQSSVVPSRGRSWTPRASSNLRPFSEPYSGSPVTAFSTSSSVMLRVSDGGAERGHRCPGSDGRDAAPGRAR